MPVECGNCDWRGRDDEATPLYSCCDLFERLDPGSEVPYGDCPICRCFVYLVEEPKHHLPLKVFFVWMELAEKTINASYIISSEEPTIEQLNGAFNVDSCRVGGVWRVTSVRAPVQVW